VNGGSYPETAVPKLQLCLCFIGHYVVNEAVSLVMYLVVLGGVMVSVFVTGHKVHRLKPGRGRLIFNDDKNPQNAFLQKGSKAVGLML
jgi:hypothetical protein